MALLGQAVSPCHSFGGDTCVTLVPWIFGWHTWHTCARLSGVAYVVTPVPWILWGHMVPLRQAVWGGRWRCRDWPWVVHPRGFIPGAQPRGFIPGGSSRGLSPLVLLRSPICCSCSPRAGDNGSAAGCALPSGRGHERVGPGCSIPSGNSLGIANGSPEPSGFSTTGTRTHCDSLCHGVGAQLSPALFIFRGICDCLEMQKMGGLLLSHFSVVVRTFCHYFPCSEADLKGHKLKKNKSPNIVPVFLGKLT